MSFDPDLCGAITLMEYTSAVDGQVLQVPKSDDKLVCAPLAFKTTMTHFESHLLVPCE